LARVIGYLVATFLGCVLIGGAIGALLAKPATFSSATFGEVAAHHCVVERGDLCGLYPIEGQGAVEISENTQLTREVVIPGTADRIMPTIRKEAIAPGTLDADQIEAAMASRTQLFKTALASAVALGAGLGAAIWTAVAVLLAGVIVLRWLWAWMLARRGPGRAKAGARRPAVALPRVLATVWHTFGEGIRLRAEVRRSELLVRKAVAEAKLNRADPDALLDDTEAPRIARP